MATNLDLSLFFFAGVPVLSIPPNRGTTVLNCGTQHPQQHYVSRDATTAASQQQPAVPRLGGKFRRHVFLTSYSFLGN